MGRQISFYFTPEDMLTLEPALQDLSAMFIESRMKEHCLETVSSLQVKEKSLLRVYLAQRRDCNKIVLREVPVQNYWTVDSRKSPAIELDRCFFDGKILRRGRIFYDAGYYDDAGKWADKPKEFLEWATEIFKLFKNSGTRNPKVGAYLGFHAKDLLSKNSQLIVD